MEFGLQFFPSVGNEVTAESYFDTALDLCAAGEAMGYTHARDGRALFSRRMGASRRIRCCFLSAVAQRYEVRCA